MVQAPQKQKGEPGHHGQGGQGGEGNGQGDVDGHGLHVGTHHASDKEHGQEGDDDGQGRHDHRRQDLGHGRQCGFPRGFLAHADVALDVVHVGDGIVHHQSQGQDKGKKGNPIDGVAGQVVYKQGQGKAHGDGKGHHQCLPPAKGKGKEQDHREDRKQEGTQEIVDLVLGGLSVVPGDFQVHPVGE